MARLARPRLAVQLYTLRDTGDDVPTMLRRVAAMGYLGVEAPAAQLCDVDPGALAAVLDETGMVVSSAHVVLDSAGRLGGSSLTRCRRRVLTRPSSRLGHRSASPTPVPSPRWRTISTARLT